MKKSEISVIFYFLVWCKAREKGWDDLAYATLNALHDHGFDVKVIGGRWNLVKLEDEGIEGETNVHK
jgi:hypothetical protein